MPGKRFLVSLALVVALGAVLRVAWLSQQVPSGDDANVVWTAVNYVENGQPNPTMAYHPVLRNVLVYVSSRMLGNGALGVKGFSLLLGTLLIAVTGLFGRRVARDDRAGLIAAGLVALDIVQIDYSRQAIQEVHAAFFAMLGAYLIAEALLGDDTRDWRSLLPLAGLSFGLGVASKFYAIAPLILSIALVGWAVWKRRLVNEAIVAGASLVPLSFTVFLLTYIPWFRRGYDLGEWVRFQAAVIEAMVTHYKAPVAYLAYNKAALWFVAPFYGFADVATTAAGKVQLTIAVGNPLVWLAVLPAVAYSLLTPSQRRRDALALAFFAASYLPLALSSRPVWLLSSVAVFPFAAAVLGSVVSGLARRYGSRIAWAYASVVVVTSLLLYPLAIGRALDTPYLAPIVAHMGDYMDAPSRASQ